MLDHEIVPLPWIKLDRRGRAIIEADLLAAALKLSLHLGSTRSGNTRRCAMLFSDSSAYSRSAIESS